MESKVFDIYDFLEEKDLPIAKKAIVFAHVWHHGQKRDNGRDYIDHPLAVCYLLITYGVIDDIVLAASLLHDVKEDCGVTDEELKQRFPYAVAHLVGLVSKEEGEPAGKVFARISSDTRSVIIKLADRTHNMSEAVGVFNRGRLQKYIRETEDYVLPMAEQAAATSPYYGRKIRALKERIGDLVGMAKIFVAKEEEHEKVMHFIRRLTDRYAQA
jgi:(p)ppGpp synthase/HD superfamily hydrolase